MGTGTWSVRGRSANPAGVRVEPSATAPRRCVEHVGREAGLRKDGLQIAERREVRELKARTAPS